MDARIVKTTHACNVNYATRAPLQSSIRQILIDHRRNEDIFRKSSIKVSQLKLFISNAHFIVVQTKTNKEFWVLKRWLIGDKMNWLYSFKSNFSVLWLLLVGRWKYRCAYRAHALQASQLNWKVFASINISENQSSNNMHETWTIQSFQNRRISTIIFELSSQFWIERSGELTFQPFFCTMGTWYCRYLSTKMTLVLKI